MNKIDTTNWTRQQFIEFYNRVWLCSVLPIHESKKPAVPEWNCYKERMPTPEELDTWFVKRKAWGLTMILKNKLFAVDFDLPEAYELFKNKIPAGACIKKTRHGYHVLMRSSGTQPETIKGSNQQWKDCLKKIAPWLIVTDKAGHDHAKVDFLGTDSLFNSPDSPGYEWLELYDEPVAVNLESFLKEMFGYSPPMHRISDFIKVKQGDVRGRWLPDMFCPWCEFGDGIKHDSPSLGVDIEGGGYVCRGSCGKHGTLTELVEYVKTIDGYTLPQAVLDWVEEFQRRQRGGKIKGLVTATPSNRTPIKRVGWSQIEDSHEGAPLIEDLLPSGENAKCLVIGAAKAGKTTLMVTIIVCVSQNIPVFGAFKPARALRTAYGNFEQKGIDIKRQIERMAPAYGKPLDDMLTLLNLKDRKLSDPADCEDIIKELTTEPRIELVVFDSVYRAVNKINEDEEVDAVIRFMTRLVDELGCAVIIGHHSAVPVVGFGDQVIESALGKLGKALDRWCGSRLIYNDIPHCKSEYYGELKGQVRGGIGLVDHAIAYTEVTGGLHFIPWEDVPMEGRRGENVASGKHPRVRAFQQVVIFARTKGYKPTHIARKLDVSDETVSKWINGESIPSDENWERVKKFRDELMAAPAQEAGEVDKEQTDKPIAKVTGQRHKRRGKTTPLKASPQASKDDYKFNKID